MPGSEGAPARQHAGATRRDLQQHHPAQSAHPNDFTDLDEIAARLAAFERRYGQTATAFEWKFTRHDLDLLLKRLADKPDLAHAA